MEAPRTPAQWYATLAGVFLTALGVVSLVIADVSFGTVENLGGTEGFLIWEVTGWTTIAWIAAGALGLLAMARIDAARTYALVAGIFFAAIAVWGFIDGTAVFSLIVADTPNNITHAVLGALGLAVALPSERKQREYGVGEPHEGVREQGRVPGERTTPQTPTGTRR